MKSAGAAETSPLWCRLEMEGSRIRRVNAMHADGRIVASWPPQRFDPDVLSRMRAGQVRARVAGEPEERRIELSDESGAVLLSEPLSNP